MGARWPVEMMARKREQNPDISPLMEEPPFPRKAKFEVYGEEMIENPFNLEIDNQQSTIQDNRQSTIENIRIKGG